MNKGHIVNALILWKTANKSIIIMKSFLSFFLHILKSCQGLEYNTLLLKTKQKGCFDI